MQKNITHVKGFKCWGSHIGIKSKRRDLAIIFSENQADAAAVFTKNLVRAEPVKLSEHYISDGKAQAFVINSGNANACTGKQGMEGAKAMAETAAKHLEIREKDVIVASTGIIGVEFPTDKVVEGIKENIPNLTDREVAGSLVSNAILTTDTFAKEGHLEFKVDGKLINMAGVAKGSGMIHPNMGTMLAFILCDINIDSHLLDKALKEITDDTFNMINVDGDTSTNDMVGIMCNGQAGNKRIVEEDDDFELFKTNLKNICEHFARQIVSDGEGATKFIEYKVSGAPSKEDAKQVVRTISDSKLVQTAMFGRDPNWGRILAAAGRSGVQFNPENVDLFFGKNRKVPLLKKGQPATSSAKELKKIMKESHIIVYLDLNHGQASSTGWGTDISYEYVRINAEYST
jgi:glutamate N-acetyltransferase/amino-acid N-acetyltransferase